MAFDLNKRFVSVLLLFTLISSFLLNVLLEVRVFAVGEGVSVKHEVSLNEAGPDDTVIYTLKVTVAAQTANSGFVQIQDAVDANLDITDTFIPKVDVNGTKTNVGSATISGNNIQFDLIDQKDLAGKTFDLKVYAKFKGTSIDQTIAKNQVSMNIADTKNGAPTDISEKIDVRMTETKFIDPSEWNVLKSRIDPAGGTTVAGDEDVTYQLSVKRSKGSSALEKPILEDLIPSGAIVKKIGNTEIINNQNTTAADFEYKDGKIKWTLPKIATGREEDITSSKRTIVLNYPLAQFENAEVTNIANLYDDATKLSTANAKDTVKNGGEVSLLEVKKIAQTDVSPADTAEVQPGGNVTWEFSPIAIEGPSRKAKLIDFTLTDEVPSDMTPVAVVTGAYTNLDVPNHPYKIIYTLKDGETKTLADNLSSETSTTLQIPEADRSNIKTIQYVYGQVSPGFKATTFPKIRMNLKADTTEKSVTNKAYLSYKLGKDTKVVTGGGVPDEDGFTINFDGNINVGGTKTLLCLKKELISTESNIQKGDELEFKLSLKNVTEVESNFAEPVIIDGLPNNMSYVAGSARVIFPGQSASPIEPTGTKSLVFDVSENPLKKDEEIIITLKATVDDEAQVQQANFAYAGTLAASEQEFSASNCGNARNITDTTDFDKDGKSDDRLIRDSISFKTNVPIVSIEKKENPDGEKIVKASLPTGKYTNSSASYILTATNESVKGSGIERGDEMKKPIIIDVLPAQLLYNAAYSPTFTIERVGGQTVSATPTIAYDGTLRSVRYTFSETLLPGERIIGNVKYDVALARGGKITNQALFTTNESPIYKGEKGSLGLEKGKDYSAGGAEEFVQAENSYYLLDEYQLFETAKSVKGELDSNFIKGDGKEGAAADSGTTTAGGKAAYTLLMENNGTVREKISVLMDTLPTIGDKDIISGAERNSEFDFTLLDIGTPQLNGKEITSPFSIEYTTTAPKADGSGDWTTTKPTPFTDVVAFRIVFTTPVMLEPGEKIQVAFNGVADKEATVGQYAYNAFHVNEAVVLASGREKAAAWNTPLKVALKVQGNEVGKYSLGDTVFFDQNRDGMKNAGEPGIDGVKVILKKDGATIADTLTNNGGTYRFGNLPNGTYDIEFEQPDGLKFTTQSKDSPLAVDNDSDASESGLVSGIIINGKDQDEVDAGLIGVNLGDFVFYDKNGNGTQDGGEEVGISGIKVELLRDGKKVAEQTTDVNGKYRFTAEEVNGKSRPLIAGNYTVRFTKDDTYLGFTRGNKGSDETDSDVTFTKASTATTGNYKLNAGEENLTVDAGLFKGASVGDYVWFDANKNGIQDAGEAPFAGMKVVLQQKDGAGYVSVPGTGTVTTDASGKYTFKDVIPGQDYRVVFDLGFSKVIATVNDAGNDETRDSDSDSDGNTGLFDLVVDQDKTDLDLGVLGGELGDFVFYDKNGNGIQDGGEEVGISGIKVELLRGGTVVATETTNENGLYRFIQEESGITAKPLVGGSYTIRFTLPGGSEYAGFTKNAAGGNETKDSNVDFKVGTVGTTAPFSLAAGAIDETIDAGLFKGVTIGDYVWFDANRDGIQDGSEKGIAGIKVTLQQEINGTYQSNSEYPSVVTDSSGKYTFKNVIPGSNYRVVFDLDAAKAIATKTGETSDEKDSNINALGQTAPFTIQPETDDLTLDAGLYGIEIGDYVFEDRDGDGVQDAGEEPIENVTLTLFSGSTQIATTKTDQNGAYRFTQTADGSYLPYGDYRVVLTLPSGKILTKKNIGDDQTDSDFDPTTKSVDVSFTKGNVNAGQGFENLTVDAGLVTLSSFIGRTWFDQNQDGIRDSSEPLLSGMIVELYNAAGTKLLTTTTDAAGIYRFEDVLPGDYYVKFLPGLYQPTQFQQGDATKNSDFDLAVGNYGQSNLFTIRSNELNVDKQLDAGFLSSKIGDFVFEDIDADGQQSIKDKAIPNVVVRLLQNGLVVQETTTDVDGKYFFDRMNNGTRPLGTGNYVIEVVKPEGFNFFTRRDQGTDDALDSDIRRSTGQTLEFNFDSKTDRLDIDAGLLKELKGIGDLVFFDDNRNGIQDAGEVGVPNVTVKLMEIADTGTVVSTLTTKTNENGQYLFENLPGGDYKLEFMLPSEYRFTTRNAGGDDTKDSDVVPASDPLVGQVTVRLGENASDLTIDAGVLSGTIGDFVFEDLDYDGVQDVNEPGIANRLVTLEQKENGAFKKVSEQQTDANGKYVFRHLSNGEYRVTVDTTGYFETKRFIGANDLDSNVSGGVTDSVLLQVDDLEKSTNLHLDAGLFRPASVTGVIWLDGFPKDGTRQSGERLLQDTTVVLVDAAGNAVKDVNGKDVLPVKVGADGRYTFTDLFPGDYTLKTSRDDFLAYQDVTIVDTTRNADFIPQTNAFTSQVNVRLQSAETKQNIDAAFIGSTVSGIATVDQNADGVREVSDPRLANVTVELYRDGTKIGSKTTESDGTYRFTELPTGNYEVRFPDTKGYLVTRPNIGEDTRDSDAVLVNGTYTTETFVVGAGTDSPNHDIGFYSLASIGGLAWVDLNRDGVRQQSEFLLPNAVVNLFIGTSTTPIQTQETGKDGSYLFSGLMPGMSYRVEINHPSYRLTEDRDRGNDDQRDSDFEPSSSNLGKGQSTLIYLPSGAAVRNIDAGYLAGALGDRIWLDANANGKQDDSEKGISNVRVELLDKNGKEVKRADGSTVLPVLTDMNGNYRFEHLPAGEYQVKVETPKGLVQTFLQVGDTTKDSNVNSSGLMEKLSLEVGQIREDADGGYYALASIGDRVFIDLNKNGIQDKGEQGLANVKVSLYRGTDLIKTLVTDANGNYRFDQLVPGEYRLVFEEKDGFQFTQPNLGPEETDSDVNSKGETPNITLMSGDQPMTIDAGFVPDGTGNGKSFGSIGDRVWVDVDENAVQSPADLPLAGVTVFLFDETGKILLFETKTDASGKYLFTGLPEGKYIVQVKYDMKKYDIVSPFTGEDETKDSNINQEGLSKTVTLGKKGDTVSTDLSIDAGLQLKPKFLGSIGKRVWLDLNKNGLYDEGEPVMKNVEVTLYRYLNGKRVKVETILTDSKGNYLFDGLQPGDYQVEFELPDGYVFTKPNVDPKVGSDTKPDGTTVTITIRENQDNLDIWAGLYPDKENPPVTPDPDDGGVIPVKPDTDTPIDPNTGKPITDELDEGYTSPDDPKTDNTPSSPGTTNGNSGQSDKTNGNGGLPQSGEAPPLPWQWIGVILILLGGLLMYRNRKAKEVK